MTLNRSVAITWTLLLLTTWGSAGCKQNESATKPPADASTSSTPETPVPDKFEPQTYSASVDELLAARLASKECAEGWVRLFDGHTLFGWETNDKANFRIEDGAIVVDQGAQCLMCTSSTWGNFELVFNFKADQKTNSGVFVRTPFEPENVTSDCYEINIAPDDNPFPTGSIVMREKVDGEMAGPQQPGQWADDESGLPTVGT